MKAWRTRMKLSKAAAGRLFGVSQDTWARWEQRSELDRYIGLACAAISFGLPPAEG